MGTRKGEYIDQFCVNVDASFRHRNEDVVDGRNVAQTVAVITFPANSKTLQINHTWRVRLRDRYCRELTYDVRENPTEDAANFRNLSARIELAR